MTSDFFGLHLYNASPEQVDAAWAAAAAQVRRVTAERTAHRLALEVERLRAEGVTGQAAIARALTERGVPTPRGLGTWTYTTVARVLSKAIP